MRTLTIASAIAVVTMAMPGAALAQEGPHHFSTTIPVGGEGGWDYLSVDSAALGRGFASNGRENKASIGIGQGPRLSNERVRELEVERCVSV